MASNALSNSLSNSPDDAGDVEEELARRAHLVPGLSNREAEELLRRRLILEHPAEHLEAALRRVTWWREE